MSGLHARSALLRCSPHCAPTAPTAAGGASSARATACCKEVQQVGGRAAWCARLSWSRTIRRPARRRRCSPARRLLRAQLPAAPVAHVELVVPWRRARALHQLWAYIGEDSGWQVDQKKNCVLHLAHGGGARCRLQHAARKVRAACAECCQVDYSMLRYLTAPPPMRARPAYARRGARRRTATLTARVLRRALGGAIDPGRVLRAGHAVRRADRGPRRGASRRDDGVDGHTQTVIRKLLHSTLPELAQMPDAEVLPALRSMTLKVAAAEAFGDSAVQVLTQRQLGSALLRWSVARGLRGDGSG